RTICIQCGYIFLQDNPFLILQNSLSRPPLLGCSVYLCVTRDALSWRWIAVPTPTMVDSP
ncbi:TPA: hypothetical protein ACS781_003910, partial [Providencia alcalifaciens]